VSLRNYSHAYDKKKAVPLKKENQVSFASYVEERYSQKIDSSCSHDTSCDVVEFGGTITISF